ncbi:MAG: hypothetical protein AAFZ52_20010, partial [Bacteroidota bacterium]
MARSNPFSSCLTNLVILAGIVLALLILIDEKLLDGGLSAATQDQTVKPTVRTLKDFNGSGSNCPDPIHDLAEAHQRVNVRTATERMVKHPGNFGPEVAFDIFDHFVDWRY